MAMVTCGGCKIKFDRAIHEAEFIKGKWYHEGCAQIKKDKMKLDAYICKTFQLKSPGPTNNILIKKYKEEKGYSFTGMLNALKYFYEIKKHPTDKSEERVGIIPYVYNDAQEYFRIQEEKNNRTSKSNNTKEEQIVVNLNCLTQNKQKENDLSELESLFEE